MHQHVEAHALLPLHALGDEARHLGVVGGAIDLALAELDAQLANLRGLRK